MKLEEKKWYPISQTTSQIALSIISSSARVKSHRCHHFMLLYKFLKSPISSVSQNSLRIRFSSQASSSVISIQLKNSKKKGVSTCYSTSRFLPSSDFPVYRMRQGFPARGNPRQGRLEGKTQMPVLQGFFWVHNGYQIKPIEELGLSTSSLKLFQGAKQKANVVELSLKYQQKNCVLDSYFLVVDLSQE